jgi:L-alanine-DL-glutamate epimerase-like enolase superfamily enzyme
MAQVCRDSPVPVALDEELIGVDPSGKGHDMLHIIRPDYLILKPGLIGGFRNSEKWIGLAEETAAGWWVTSALESSVGLNAIAQWTFMQQSAIPQGLGTGAIYRNNLLSPLQLKGDSLWYHPQGTWDLPLLNST